LKTLKNLASNFCYKIVGFKSRSSVVVKCFESREEDECDIIFKTEDVRNFPEVIPKKIKMKKKRHTSVRGKSLGIQNNRIFTLSRLREFVMINDNFCVFTRLLDISDRIAYEQMSSHGEEVYLLIIKIYVPQQRDGRGLLLCHFYKILSVMYQSQETTIGSMNIKQVVNYISV